MRQGLLGGGQGPLLAGHEGWGAGGWGGGEGEGEEGEGEKGQADGEGKRYKRGLIRRCVNVLEVTYL